MLVDEYFEKIPGTVTHHCCTLKILHCCIISSISLLYKIKKIPYCSNLKILNHFSKQPR